MSDRVLVRCKVVGAMPIRDAVTKQSVPQGQIVQLEPRDPATLRPGSTMIEPLIASGAIELLADEPARAKKA